MAGSSSEEEDEVPFTPALIKHVMLELAQTEAARNNQQSAGLVQSDATGVDQNGMRAANGEGDNAKESDGEEDDDAFDEDDEDEYEEDGWQCSDEEGIDSDDDWVEAEESESEWPCSEEEYREELFWALTNVERPGSFCVEGTLKAFGPPGLEVARLGPIGLPLTAPQAKELAKLCSQAPFGRREATLYDDTVRRCLQLSPDQFRLQGPDWAAQVQRIANGEIKRGLGVPENVKVVPQLYKLLLYEAGSFFTPHRDSEKEDGMFGTLAIVLPSSHSGGELVIRHAGRESTFDFASRNLYQIHYGAFYTDCEHEIRPVKKGHRLVLVYNLIAQGGTAGFAPADNRQAVKDVLVAIKAWSQDEEGPAKLVIPLEHQYSAKSLSFNGLKGPDIAMVDVLCQAAKVPDGPRFHFYLGMLKRSESGPEDFYDGLETTLELKDIIAPEGEKVRYSKLECDEIELVPEDALEEHDWDHERSHDTGNEGSTVERWYHHAALVLWPHTKHWDVACTNNMGKAIKEAAALTQTAKAVQAALEGACSRSGGLSSDEAATVAELVMEHGDVDVLAELRHALKTICRHGKKLTSSQAGSLAKLLLKHGDVEMVRILLQHFPSPADGPLLPVLASRFGWSVLQADIIEVLERACDNKNLADCCKLLLRIAPKLPQTTTSPQAEPGAPSHADGSGVSRREGVSAGEKKTSEAAGGASKEGEKEPGLDLERTEAGRMGSEAVEGSSKTGVENQDKGQPQSEVGQVPFRGKQPETGREPSDVQIGTSGGQDQISGSRLWTSEERKPVSGGRKDANRSNSPSLETATGATITRKRVFDYNPPEDSASHVAPRQPTRDEQEREELCRHAIPKLVERIAREPQPKDHYSITTPFRLSSDNMPAFVRVVERFGAEAWAPAIDTLIGSKKTISLRSAAEILWDFVRNKEATSAAGALKELSAGALGFCRRFADELVTSLTNEKDPEQPSNVYTVRLPPYRDAPFVTLFLKTLHCLDLDQTVSDSVVPHLLATPRTHPVDTILVPVLKELASWLGERPMDTPWFAELWKGCEKALKSGCVEPPEPQNWAMSASCGCSCADCQRLLAFCHDQARTEIRLPVSVSVKTHLIDSINRYALPLTVFDLSMPMNTPLVCIKVGSKGVEDENLVKDLVDMKAQYRSNQKAFAEMQRLVV